MERHFILACWIWIGRKSCHLPVVHIAKTNSNPNILYVIRNSLHLTSNSQFPPKKWPSTPLPTKSHFAQPMMMAGLLIHPLHSQPHPKPIFVRPSIASSLHRPSITNPAEGGKKGNRFAGNRPTRKKEGRKGSAECKKKDGNLRDGFARMTMCCAMMERRKGKEMDGTKVGFK